MRKQVNLSNPSLFDMSAISSTNISLPTQTNISPNPIAGDFFSDIAKEEKKANWVCLKDVENLSDIHFVDLATIFVAGKINLVFGKPKVGKTTFCVNYLSKSVFGSQVYFVDLDFNIPGKLKMACQKPDEFFYQATDIKGIWDTIESIPEDSIVVIDCLTRFAVSNETKKLIKVLKKFRKYERQTFIIIHHANKVNASYQGSNLIESLVDQTISVEPDCIKVISSRYQAPKSIPLKITYPQFELILPKLEIPNLD